MINYSYPYPYLVLSGDVMDSTSSKLRFRELTDLAGSISVGIYDHDTQAIATGSGNGKKFFVGYSSEHTKDFLDKYIFGAKLPRGNSYWSFKGADVLSFEYSDPTYVNNERWVIGWSGSDACDAPLPKFECGKRYGVKVRAYGSEISKRWNGDFVREYWSKSFPCTNTAADCVDGVCPTEYVDPVTVLKSIAEKLNSDFETKQIYLKARTIASNYSTTVANMHTYTISVTDDGSNNALAKVQKTVPKPFEVKRINRVGLVSVYEVCALTLPSAFQPDPQGYFTKNCDGCNQTLSNATYFDVYTVTITADNATDIDTEGERTALINGRVTTYSGVTGSGTYVSHDGTELVMTFRKTKGSAAPTPSGTDVIDLTDEAFTLTMPSTIAWTLKCDAYRAQRTLCITLPRVECASGNRLAELQDFYADFPNVNGAGITVTAGTDCEDTYQMVQYGNNCMTDTCLAYDSAEFDEVGAYDTAAWKVVEPAVPTYDEDVKAGLEISINFPKTFMEDDEFNPWKDNGDQAPIRLEVSFIYEPLTKFPDFDEIPVAKLVSKISFPRQSGYSVLQDYIKASVYSPFSQDFQKAELRSRLDANLRKQVDRNSLYRIYYLKFKVDRGNTNWDQKGEIVEIPIAVPLTRPDKMAKLEAAILAPLTKFGVELVKRA